MRFMLIILPLLVGCSPFVGYSHLSDPMVSGDGYDLVCGGAKIGDGLEVSAAVCKNVRGGEMIKVDMEWVFRQ